MYPQVVSEHMDRVALLSVHGCPVSRLGERDSGGMNVYVLQLAKELGKLGIKADIYTRYHDPNDPQVVDLGENARAIHLKAGPYDRAKETLHRYVPEFISSLYRFQFSEGIAYDLVHSHYWLSGAAGLELAQEWNTPHVTMFHTLAKIKMQARAGESESEQRLAMESQVMGSVDAIVASTGYEKDDLGRLYEVASQKVRVMPAGVDIELFRPLGKARSRRELGVTEGKVLLSVGRIEPLKGLDILLRAMAMLEDADDTRLLLVGGDPDRDRYVQWLKSLAVELRIDDAVTFVGAVPQSELPTYYSAADLFVLPSYYESFGLVALEAMACGVPVVASRFGGPSTFIKGGETGYLVPWHCPEPYAQRIDMLLSSQHLRESMGRAARAKAESMSWSAAARSTVDLYSTLMGSGWRSAVGA